MRSGGGDVPPVLHDPWRPRHHRCVCRCSDIRALCPPCPRRGAGHSPPSPPAPHGSPPLAWPRAENDVAIFHISLWSSVFLVLATCYAGCALSYMDTGDDSIFNIDISAGVKKVGAHGLFCVALAGALRVGAWAFFLRPKRSGFAACSGKDVERGKLALALALTSARCCLQGQ